MTNPGESAQGEAFTEERQVASPPFFCDVVRSAPGATAIVRTKDFRIVAINQQFTTFLGYSENDINAENVTMMQLLCESRKKDFIEYLRHMESPEEAPRYDYIVTSLKSAKGDTGEYYTYMSPLHYSGTIQKGFVTVMFLPFLFQFPIPFQSQQAREVHLEELQNYNFGLIEWTTDEDLVSLSEGMSRILETENFKNEVTINFLSNFVNDVDRLVVREQLSVLTDEGIKTELKIVTAQNNIKILRVNARYFDVDKKRKKLVASVRDITREYQIEQGYHKKVEELANSNAELEEFAYVASHDLQEPLRKISTFCSRLEQKYSERLDDEGRMYVERALVSAENMRLLINDLLEFSRIPKTKQPFEQVDLNLIFRMVRSDLELVIEETHAQLLCDTLPTLPGIKSQLIQLFSNLISNAIKFRAKNQTPIVQIKPETMGAKEKVETGLNVKRNYTKITFTDNGIGFENAYASRIFQVFQRLHGRSEYSGSGIGLSICKKIAEHHHGQIYASGNPGKGSCFTVILPSEPESV